MEHLFVRDWRLEKFAVADDPKRFHVGENTHGTLRVASVSSDKGAFLSEAIREAKRKDWVFEHYPDCQKALQSLPAFEPNIALICLADVDIDSAQKLKHAAPDLPIITLSDKLDNERMLLSLSLGARGYLIQPVSPAELVNAITRVAGGGSVLCEEAQTVMLTYLHRAFATVSSNTEMTQRERQIMVCLAEGLSDKEIGDRLKIAPNTVHVYLVRLFQKLGVHNRNEAVQSFFGGRGCSVRRKP